MIKTSNITKRERLLPTPKLLPGTKAVSIKLLCIIPLN